MAKRKFTPKARSRLKQAVPRPSQGVPPSPEKRESLRKVGRTADAVREEIIAAVEQQRTKLMRARAVLDCVQYVLLYEDDHDGASNSPSYADAVSVARDLVSQSIEALDRVNLSRDSD